MKALFLNIITLLIASNTFSQTSFMVQADTVWASPALGVSTAVEDRIAATTGTVSAVWKVVNTDFPSDWLASTGVCDNHACYTCTSLWTIGTGSLGSELSLSYDTLFGNFDLLVAFTPTVSVGCHFMTIKLSNSSNLFDSAYETYIICHAPELVNNFDTENNDLKIFPIPASDWLNLQDVYAKGYKVLNIYTLDGLSVMYRTQITSQQQIDISNLVAGNYYMLLFNALSSNYVYSRFIKK
jgi:hypothetical protein